MKKTDEQVLKEQTTKQPLRKSTTHWLYLYSALRSVY